MKLDINLDNLQVNTALVNVCESMAQAYEIYGNKGIILFVVSNDEKNLFDQIILE